MPTAGWGAAVARNGSRGATDWIDTLIGYRILPVSMLPLRATAAPHPAICNDASFY